MDLLALHDKITPCGNRSLIWETNMAKVSGRNFISDAAVGLQITIDAHLPFLSPILDFPHL